MITKEDLHANLVRVNEAFDIAIKARDLRDLGLLDKGDDIIYQAAKLGELMWVHLWEKLDGDFRPKNVLDRGEHVVVKSHRDGNQTS